MPTPPRIWTDAAGTTWRIRLDHIRRHPVRRVNPQFVLTWVEVGAVSPRVFNVPTRMPFDLQSVDDSELEGMRRSYAT